MTFHIWWMQILNVGGDWGGRRENPRFIKKIFLKSFLLFYFLSAFQIKYWNIWVRRNSIQPNDGFHLECSRLTGLTKTWSWVVGARQSLWKHFFLLSYLWLLISFFLILKFSPNSFPCNGPLALSLLLFVPIFLWFHTVSNSSTWQRIWHLPFAPHCCPHTSPLCRLPWEADLCGFNRTSSMGSLMPWRVAGSGHRGVPAGEEERRMSSRVCIPRLLPVGLPLMGFVLIVRLTVLFLTRILSMWLSSGFSNYSSLHPLCADRTAPPLHYPFGSSAPISLQIDPL